MAQEPIDRHFTALASAARTAAPTPVDIANTGLNINCRGALVTVDVTAVVDTPGITLTISVKDPASDKYEALLTASAALVGTGTASYLVYPGVGAAAADVTQVASYALPPVWRISVAHTDTDSITYSVGVNLLP